MRRSNVGTSGITDLLKYLARPDTDEFRTMTILDFYCWYTVKSSPNITDATLRPGERILAFMDNGRERLYSLKRRAKKIITPMQTYPLNSGDLYYLRALLIRFPATSWLSIRIVDGIEYPTYQATAIARGIIAVQNQAEFAMDEALRENYAPGQLRFLFASVITTFECDSRKLYDDYIDEMNLDLRDWLRLPDYRDQCLIRIQSFLNSLGTRLAKFGLPEPREVTTETDKEMDYFHAKKEQLEDILSEGEHGFNSEQRDIYEQCFEDDETPIFLDGKAGRGKSFVMNILVSKHRLHDLVVLVVGSTALSIITYDRGRTSHSTFSIPVKEGNFDFSCTVQRNSATWQFISKAYLILWEELPVAPRANVQAVHLLLQDIMDNNKPFGGKKFIGVGDFGQSAPIVKHGGQSDIINASIRSSYLWKHFKVLRLTTAMRHRADPEFSDWVDAIREGEDEFIPLDLTDVTTDKDAAILDLFPTTILPNHYECVKRSYLAPLNKTVDEVNKSFLSRLPSEAKTYYSFDSIKEGEKPPPDMTDHVLQEFLSIFNEPGIPPNELVLKKGAIFTIRRNLSIDKGLIKNAKVVITQLNKYSIKVGVLRRDGRPLTVDDIHPISRINFQFNPGKSNWTIVRMQLPLRLAYAATFNSCQGMTMDRVFLDLEIDVFAHGQLYTALTRVRRRQDSGVLLAENKVERVVRNVVFQELVMGVD